MRIKRVISRKPHIWREVNAQEKSTVIDNLGLASGVPKWEQILNDTDW